MNNVYPSIQEIMPEVLLNRIPANLAKEVEERYQSLGEKYLTDNIHNDGRRINACMYKSSVQDAIEEVVDAVFNTLVWIFKTSQPNSWHPTLLNEPPKSAYKCLSGLIEIYFLLASERGVNAERG